jgi:hypothetical protein
MKTPALSIAGVEIPWKGLPYRRNYPRIDRPLSTFSPSRETPAKEKARLLTVAGLLYGFQTRGNALVSSLCMQEIPSRWGTFFNVPKHGF